MAALAFDRMALLSDLEAQSNKTIIRLSVVMAALIGVLFAALRYLPA